ncbi:proteasome regulatory particle base subunit, partial [Perkinsus olseni]
MSSAAKSTQSMTDALSAIRRALNPDLETEKASEEAVKDSLVQVEKEKPVVKGPDWTKRYSVVSSHLSSVDDCPPVSEFGLSRTCRKALKGMGISRLFPVQATVLPIVIGRERTPVGSRYDCDLCVAIPTGQGKTLGYLLPIFQLLSHRVYRTLRALILAPTRDLALQVKEVADHFTGTKDNFKVDCVVGQYHAQTFAEQDKAAAGPDVLVATPSRALDLLTGERIPIDGIRWVVLDEADRLLNSSREATVEVVRRVMAASPRCQRMLFSATMTSNPQKLAQLALNRPFFLLSTQTGAHATPENLRHRFIVARAEQKKPGVLLSLLREIYPHNTSASSRTMLFCGSVEHAHRLARLLQICVADDESIDKAIRIREFSAALDQKHRVRMLEAFRTGRIHVLVCSDVAARGLDFREVDHVVQYDVPNSVQGYIHRCGRAGRAGRVGCSTTILVSRQVKHFKDMLREENAVPAEKLEQMKPVPDDIAEYLEKLSMLELCLKRENKGVYSLTEPVDPVALKGGGAEDGQKLEQEATGARSSKSKRPSSTVYKELLSNLILAMAFSTTLEKLSFLTLLLFCGAASAVKMVIGDWKNSKVSREITLQESTVKVTVNVDLDCSMCTGPLQYTFLKLPNQGLGKHAVADSESGDQLVVEDLGVDGADRYLRVTLPEAKNKASLNVEMIFGRMYRPLPEEILEMQEQMVEYVDAMYWPSPYPTAKETTTVRLMEEEKIERVLPEGAANIKGRSITFGPYEDIKPSKAHPDLFHVHVSHPFPLPYFAKSSRVIEVSHWGSVSVTGRYELVNEAARLGGEFSRIPFSIDKWGSPGENPYSVTSCVNEIEAVLPRSVRNINYRDAIGNVSSTHARREGRKYVSVELAPRFPMLGGWKDEFEFSYDLPARTTLQVSSSDSNQYVLSVAFNQPFVRVFAQQQELEVVLPAGAMDIKVNSPRGLGTFDYIPEGRYSWLDFTTPRKLIRFTSSGIIVPERNALNTKIQIAYRMPSGMGVLDKPALLVMYVFALFLAYIIFNRVSLRIVTGKAEASKIDSRAWDYSVSLKVADLFEDLCHVNEKMLRSAKGPVHKLEKAIVQQTAAAGSLCSKMRSVMGMDTPTEGSRKFTDGDLAKRVVATCEEYASTARSLSKTVSKMAVSESDAKNYNVVMAEEKSAAAKYSDVENLCANLIQKMEEQSKPSSQRPEMGYSTGEEQGSDTT